METLLQVLRLVQNASTVKKQTLLDPIAQHAMMVLKQRQAGIIARDVPMALWLMMLLITIARDVPMV